MFMCIKWINISRSVFFGVPIKQENLLKFVASVLDNLVLADVVVASNVLALNGFNLFVLHAESLFPFVLYQFFFTALIFSPASLVSIVEGFFLLR
jgi:hypothetical protein